MADIHEAVETQENVQTHSNEFGRTGTAGMLDLPAGSLAGKADTATKHLG